MLSRQAPSLVFITTRGGAGVLLITTDQRLLSQTNIDKYLAVSSPTNISFKSHISVSVNPSVSLIHKLNMEHLGTGREQRSNASASHHICITVSSVRHITSER